MQIRLVAFDRRLVAFAVLCKGLELLKALVTKLQKRNQDIYEAYKMIDQVINDLRETKDDMDEKFHQWYEMACELAKSVDVCLRNRELVYFYTPWKYQETHSFPMFSVVIEKKTVAWTG